MSCEERLRSLGLSGLERRKVKGDRFALNSFLRIGSGEEGADLFSMVSNDRTPGNGLDLEMFLYQEGAQTPEDAFWRDGLCPKTVSV